MAYKTDYFKHWRMMDNAKTDDEYHQALLLRDESAKKALKYASYLCLHAGINNEYIQAH